MMKIAIRDSTIVRPAEETPKTKLWISNLDQMLSTYLYTNIVYFYRPNDASEFFDTKLMKDALSKVLVAFYPVAGRLNKNQNGRIEINCQGQGVLFQEAESDGVIDDFGDFAPRLEFMKLIPTVDCSVGIVVNPLLLVQVTFFKCGGVTLGVGIDHHLVDGLSMIHFINSWSEMARGLDLTLPPIIDRNLLQARDPPQPFFEHVEFQPLPSLKCSQLKSLEDEIVTSTFKLSLDQIKVLKTKTKDDGNTMNFTLYELLAAHIWRSVCKSRGLQDDQDTTLCIPVDARARFQPALLPGYFGNVVIFMVTNIAVAGKLQSNTILYTTKKVHDAIAQINSEYLNSAIDYLELQPDLNAMFSRLELKCPNLLINSWTRLRVYEADFGWGRPMFMGPAYMPQDGLCTLLPTSQDNNRSMSMVISLQAHQMELFSKFFYDI